MHLNYNCKIVHEKIMMKGEPSINKTRQKDLIHCQCSHSELQLKAGAKVAGDVMGQT